ncbi:hypothetical protein LTR50_002034 [Elasticomyces elasticus]|nr:hypothetical protein LTR50_002034 [Elasticomyces elasticus]
MSSSVAIPDGTSTRKAIPPHRIVPAIPIALTRPRTAKRLLPEESKRSSNAGNTQEPSTLEAKVHLTESVPESVCTAETTTGGVKDHEGHLAPRAGPPKGKSETAVKDSTEMGGLHPPVPNATISSSQTQSSLDDQRPPMSVPSASSHQASLDTESNLYHGTNLRFGSIMCGERLGSSSSSPASPRSAGSAHMPPQMTPFVPPGMPQDPTLHVHHISQFRALAPHHSAYAPPFVPYEQTREANLPQPFAQHWEGSNGHALHRFGPPDGLPAFSYASHLNGSVHMSRSSDIPGGMLPNEQGAASSGFHPRYQTSSGLPMPAHVQAEMGTEDDTVELQKFLIVQFGNPDFADYILQLVGLDRSAPAYLEWPAHGLLLARSPGLTSLMRGGSRDGPRRLRVAILDPFMNSNAFMDALRYLYGGRLLHETQFLQALQSPHHAPLEHHTSGVLQQCMQHLLSYVACGHVFQLPIISMRGIDIASRLLRWETVEMALHFALEGGLGPNWRIDDSEDRASTSSSEDSFVKNEMTSSPLYDPYSTHLLHNIIDFIVQHFPPSFSLDTSVRELTHTPRLPVVQKHRASITDPRLTRIRFGSMTIDDPPRRPTYAMTMLSSIFVSLPFPVLKCLLEHYGLSTRLGWENVASVMRVVITEREARRGRVARDCPPEGLLWQNVYWEELVEPSSQHRCGFKLVRRREIINTPPSSTSTSTRQNDDAVT